MTHAFLSLPPSTARLDHCGLIRASGPDAASFLHGQLTNDISNLPHGQFVMAGYCSPKGRLLASFIVWREGSEDIMLLCHRSVLAATLKRLSMFVMRAKCRLIDVTTTCSLWGIWTRGPAPETWPAETKTMSIDAPQQSQTLLRLPDAAAHARGLWVSHSASDQPSFISEGHSIASLDTWRWLEVQSGIPTIEAATSEHFVPQMINMELIGAVNFKKGCYPGQEVVARSQYRGTTKRRMFLFSVASELAPGTEVFHDADPAQPAGMVVNAAPNPDGTGFSALVEIKLTAMSGGALHCGAVSGPVLVQKALPYAVPLDISAIE